MFQYLNIYDNDYYFCEREINYLSSDTCISISELHEICLEELKPFNVCDFSPNVLLRDDYSLCDAYYVAECPKFFKSPFKYAPTCEKAVEKY